ncbi:MAG: hypothetical protein FJY67_01335 [Calditrichaeota bacterium]|nr:hypothetical protein [Calditrichota bacterium]
MPNQLRIFLPVGVAVVAYALGAIAAFAAAPNSCVDCHSQIHEQIIADSKEDVHTRVGLTCVSCHGGNPSIADEKSMDPKEGFIGAPKPKDIPQFCARCHSDPAYMRPYNPSLPVDQLEKYATSRHGELLKKGDAKVATCISCHKSHGILPASNTRSSVHPQKVPLTCSMCHSDANYMAEYGIPTNQFAQYADSTNVHGYALFVKGDIGAPACNDCHSNHGALPPGVEQVGQVCTQCHALNGEFFRTSPHKDGFDALGLMECAFCHQASPDLNDPKARIHTIVSPKHSMIGTKEPSLCAKCHSGDPGAEMAAVVSKDLDSLEARLHHARELLERAERRGLEVSDAQWKLKSEVLQARMELRTSIHSFNLKQYVPFYERADTALNSVVIAGIAAADETRHRITYYIVMTVIIALLVAGLGLKMRDIERSRKE